MSRLQQLMFRIRGELIHREIEALQRRQLKMKRQLMSRPHVPSAHLVQGYPAGEAPLQGRQKEASTVLWFRVVALVVAFAAGTMFAVMVEPTASTHLLCSTEYETPQE
jgi:hypothetical protein